jgi:hypothetical protein
VTAVVDVVDEARSDWREVVATVILSLAAVATTWSSYQATRWIGETTKTAGRVNATRIDAARASGRANAETQVDVATFIAWVDAKAHDDQPLQAFYVERFRPEFRTAFDAWTVSDPFTNASAPRTPFATDDYRLASAATAQRLDARSVRLSGVVQENVQRGANYVLGVVLFAVALFFAGMSAKLSGVVARTVVLGVAALVFLGTSAWVATFPISVSI